MAEAADVPELARRLEEAASGFELPTADRNYDYHGQKRRVPKPRSLSASLALRLGVILLILWAVSAYTALCLLAGYVREQTLPVVTGTLEEWLAGLPEDGTAVLTLPELTLAPDYESKLGHLWISWGALSYHSLVTSADYPPVAGIPSLTTQRAVLTVDRSGTVHKNDGFYINRYQPYFSALTAYNGKLCGMGSEAKFMPEALTFREYKLLSGSFPAEEGEGEAALQMNRGFFSLAAQQMQTPMKLLDGIESGEYRFDSHYLQQSSVLRGRWLRNEAGEPETFVLAAYGWTPLLAAAKAIRPFALRLLAFFLLLGALLWLGLRRSLTRPLEKLGAALAEAPLDADPAEFDYTYRWRELRDVTSAYLLRRQMQEALAVQTPEGAADLTEALETARRKMLPLILDRGLSPKADYRAQGAAAAPPEKLEEALMALLREVLPYGDQGSELALRTLEKEGFLLAEAEVRTKWYLRAWSYAALWEGVYRLPGNSEAPGAGLRKASAAIPGSFAAVRKTKHGLCLTLGLPAAGYTR